MNTKITFCPTTVKTLKQELQQSFRMGKAWRIRRVMALLGLAERQPVRVLCERLGVSDQSIYTWRDAFVRQGLESLKIGRSPGRPPKLTRSQRTQLRELLIAGPQACGYPTGSWNSALIADLIYHQFGRTYNVHYLSTLLYNMGFSYQKARFVSDHLDEEKRALWLKETFPAIVLEARQKGALLLFADEASFAQWGSLGYSWALKGQQPLIKTSGKRKGYKVWGLIDYFTGQLFYKGQTDRFTAARYCGFLQSVLDATDKPIVLIQDGARYHTAKETRLFLEPMAKRISVYQLPSYSPDFNPIEHLWRHVKRDRTHNRYFPTFEALVEQVEAALTSCQQKPEAVIRLIGSLLQQSLDIAYAA